MISDLEDGPVAVGDPLHGVAVDRPRKRSAASTTGNQWPAVAQEVLLERLLDRRVARDRDRLAVHHVGDPHALDLDSIAVW